MKLNVHQAVAEGVELVLKKSAANKSLDNITVLIIGFKNFKQTINKLIEGESLQKVRELNMIDRKLRKIPDEIDNLDIIHDDLSMLQVTKPTSN